MNLQSGSANAYFFLPRIEFAAKNMQVLLALWLLAAMTAAFEVLEPPEPLEVRDDEALELTCTGSDPWLYCKWSFFDKDCAR